MFVASMPSIPLNLPAFPNQQVGATVLMSQSTQLPSLLLSGSLTRLLDQEGTVLSHTALPHTAHKFLSYCYSIPMIIRQFRWQILMNWRRFQSEHSEINLIKNLRPPVTQPNLQKFSGHQWSLVISPWRSLSCSRFPWSLSHPCCIFTSSLGILNLSTGSSISLTLFCRNSVLSLS